MKAVTIKLDPDTIFHEDQLPSWYCFYITDQVLEPHYFEILEKLHDSFNEMFAEYGEVPEFRLKRQQSIHNEKHCVHLMPGEVYIQLGYANSSETHVFSITFDSEPQGTIH